MRWRGERLSTNVEDRRQHRGLRIGGGLGLGGLLLVVLLAFLSGDPAAFLGDLEGGVPEVMGAPSSPNPNEEELIDFVRAVLASTEDVWREVLPRYGENYREPTLVLFREGVESACGMQAAAVGPFYCPADEQVYLDLSFFHELERRLGAPGDFAQAYVIAHEVGHHVQRLLGTERAVRDAQAQASGNEANDLSVRMELQADFYAGVWAHHAERARGVIEPGDIGEALRAAAQVGDDNLQQRSRGRVVPESFTHGTSEQRMRWFRKGLESGDLSQGKTFEVERL